jgi:hypothetical protein
VCDVCERANATRASFKNAHTFPAQRLNEICYVDLKGPIKVPALGGYRYVLVLVDGYSGYVTASLLVRKSDALDRFRVYVNIANSKHGHRLSRVNSDNAGELFSDDWNAYCKDNGIEQRSTTAHTPEQNGTAEVRFRILFRKVRSLLLHASLPKIFWGSAFLMAVHLTNVCPSRSRRCIPYEVWHGHPADYSRLHVFGCVAYTYVPERPRKQDAQVNSTRRDEFDSRGMRGILIGLSQSKKAWRIMNCRTGTVVETAHASFDESFTPSMLEIQRHELRLLQRALQVDFNYVDPADDLDEFCHPDIPRPPALSNASGESDVTSVDEFIRSFDLSELNRPMPPSYEVALLVDQAQQVLTSNEPELTKKQLHAEALVAIENATHKSQNNAVTTSRLTPEPRSYAEAIRSHDSEAWSTAHADEGGALLANKTWVLTDLPPGKKALSCQWLFKRKYDAKGNLVRYKARLVVRGNEQVKYVDFEDIFAPVIRLESLRVLLALVAVFDLECHQVDADTAFLNGILDEEIYMQQPAGMVVPGQEKKVCRLLKSLYGLKQAPRAWYRRLTDFLKQHGFERLDSESCIYVAGRGGGDFVIVGIYVDDLVLISKTKSSLSWIKSVIGAEFKIKDLGDVHHLLGLQIARDRSNKKLTICQSTYARSVVEKFNMGHAHAKHTPAEHSAPVSQKDCPTTDQEKARMEKLDYRGLVGSLMCHWTSGEISPQSRSETLGSSQTDPTVRQWNHRPRPGLQWVSGGRQEARVLC